MEDTESSAATPEQAAAETPTKKGRRRTPDPEAKRRALRQRLWVYGSLLTVLLGVYFYQPMRVTFLPLTLPDPKLRVDPDSKALFSPGTRVMILTAHPDDCDFMIGGTLLKLGKAGAVMKLVLMTSGDKGYFTLGDPTPMIKRRQAEQTAAAEHWGAKEVVFLGYPDGRVCRNAGSIDAVRKEMAAFRPDYVFAFDPVYRPRVAHRDHTTSGEIAREAVKSCESVKWMVLFTTRAPNFFVDIDREIGDKQELLKFHPSQYHGWKLQGSANMMLENALNAGEAAGMGWAEGFRCAKPGSY